MSAHTPEELVLWCRRAGSDDTRASEALVAQYKRGVVRHALAGYYVRQRFRPGQATVYEDVSGAVGGVNTLVETSDGAVVLPNGLLLESVVKSPQGPGGPQGEDA